MSRNNFILIALIPLLGGALGFLPGGSRAKAQRQTDQSFRPEMRRALAARSLTALGAPRKDGYAPQISSEVRPRSRGNTPRAVGWERKIAAPAADAFESAALAPIQRGTSLSLVLHTAQLSISSSAGSNEQFADRTGDLVADERKTFDASGGAFDIAVGRSGTRYGVFSSYSGNRPIGVLIVASDTNGDFVRDSSASYDLDLDFGLPSAVAVVTGVSSGSREFVIVSSSGYYNAQNPNDPENEPSAGVVLLVRDPLTGGFDNARSRELVRVGSNQLNNANALALLPNNELLIADFDSNELRIVRDTNGDRVPDTLDAAPYYRYQYSNDRPLDVAANSRGVVFSHSYGNDAVLLAIYDDDGNGRADGDAVVVEGLSLDNNLILHGLATDREGTVYVVEDASGAADTPDLGGNLGSPRIDAFPDPALNGYLRDGALYKVADNTQSQALTGLSFGEDTSLGQVGHLAMVNSASLTGNATRDGLATITGSGLTFGRTGASEAEAMAKGVTVYVEGASVPVLSFNDSKINVFLPASVGAGVRSVVVYAGGYATAADDRTVAAANPGIFTVSQNGAGEAVALLASGFQYTRGPFPAKTLGQNSVLVVFGTGWRNSAPVTVKIGGKTATVLAAVQSSFSGLDQLFVTIPDGVSGAAPTVVTTAGGATSRADVFVTIQ